MSKSSRKVMRKRGSEKSPTGRPKRVRKKPRSDRLMVCIIDNDAAIRDSLTFLIDAEQIPVTNYASAHEFLSQWDMQRTGCLIVDIRMPIMGGLELQAELARRNVQVPMIFITGYGDVQLAVQAMKRGAFDFFEKPIHHQLLLDRLNLALDQEAAARQEASQKKEYQRRFDLLTPKEREVLDHIVLGQTSVEIGAELACAPKTVEVHRASIYSKLGCKNLAVLVRFVTTKRVDEVDDQGPT